MINNQISGGTKCLDAVSQITLKTDTGYTCKNITGDYVQLQIAHGAKDFVLADVQVLLSEGGTTTSYTILENVTGAVPSDLPGTNSEKTFIIDVGNGNPTEVSIAPIVTVGNTQEICDVSSTITLQDC